jgi:SPP1 gp7 family putative phage head morphogenesis protein
MRRARLHRHPTATAASTGSQRDRTRHGRVQGWLKEGRLDKPHRTRAAPGLIKARKLEARYAAELRKIARQVGLIINGWAPTDGEFDLSQVPALKRALERYSEAITPWAKSTAGRMLQEIAIKDRRAWAEHARAMSRAMRTEIREAPTGHVLRTMLDAEVNNITSLPIEAGQRVYDLSLKGLETSGRASHIAREIMRSGDVAIGKANMLARTAVSTTSSSLVEARARYVGSTGYIWRTAKDSDVRPSHARMEGQFVPWDQPPTLDGYTAHAGRFANCRCDPEPVLPDL